MSRPQTGQGENHESEDTPSRVNVESFGRSSVNGTYSLNSGSLISSLGEYVGEGGSGAFNRTGGTNTSAFTLFIGDQNGSTGACNLAGRTFTSSAEIVGNNEPATFGDTGGESNEIDSLTISGTGVFDLANTSLIINYTGKSDPVGSIQGYLASGYNGGNWNGPGINSSSSAANHSYALSYADSADPGNPARLLPDEVEIKYTLYGDANVDGVAHGVDFGILPANFGTSGKS